MGTEKYDWRFYTEPEPGLGGRRLHTPRGKVLGGSSSVNGMVYVRGNAQDFQRWESEGATGWNYASVLPYFRRAEKRAAGGDDYRGDDGPLQTRYGTLENPLHAVWLEAGRQAGYAATDDINGYQQEGFGRLDMTVGEDGRRSSAANAYLRPAMRRPNLAVKTGALATRILFDARRAIGVEYRQGEAMRLGACTPRSDCGERADQLTEASEALRHRARSGTARERHRRRRRPAGRRREPAGPHRVLLPGREHPARHALFVHGTLRARDDRRALAVAP